DKPLKRVTELLPIMKLCNEAPRRDELGLVPAPEELCSDLRLTTVTRLTHLLSGEDGSADRAEKPNRADRGCDRRNLFRPIRIRHVRLSCLSTAREISF